MTADQTKALADFLAGLNALTAETGVQIDHYDHVTLSFVGAEQATVRLSAGGPAGDGYRVVVEP